MFKVRAWAKRLIERHFDVKIYRSLPRGADFFRDMAKLLPDFDPKVIIDVGANVGLWTLDAVRELSPASVYCFEPVPAAFVKLTKRYENDYRIKCFHAAVGDTNGFVTVEAKYESSTNKVVTCEEKLPGDHYLNVPVIRLDDFAVSENLRSISVLKIDAEGYDLRVLRGAQKLLKSGLAEMVYVEAGMLEPPDVQVPFADIHKELTQHGYSLFGFYDQFHEWKTNSPRLRRVNAAYLNHNLAFRMPAVHK
jgi:FkbM family methyltransferase